MTKKRVLVIPLITLVIMTALSAMAPSALASGGDFSLNFAAAKPSTYDHGTAVGGVWADKVESLEGGDFTCGDKVVYFTEVSVAAGASGAQDVEFDYGFLAEPTGAAGVGMTDLLSVGPNPGDAAMTGNTGDTTASIVAGTEHIDTSGPKDELQATVRINNLDPGEVFILRLVVLLTCIPNSSPTGNLQGEIHAARVVDPAEDVIAVGNQTVPFKSVASVLQSASVSVSVGACPAPGSPTRPVSITITPTGSSTVTITGPGGPYVVTGSGDTLNLPHGDYSWTAVAEPGFLLSGPTSGSFTVGTCPKIPASVTVSVGACPAPGSATRPVTVTISPSGSATVVITGPGGPYNVSGSGDVLNLPAGDYSWTATADATHQLDVSSGQFTVASCPRIPATVTVTIGACPAPGSPTRPVTVDINPSGSSTVVITGPGGPYNVTGSGDTLDLAPGDYSWTATPDSEHSLEVDSGEFTVASCPAIPASVSVTVGPCPATSSSTEPVTVSIDPADAASVDITGPNAYAATVTGSGATLDLAKGTYTWAATANPTFAISGASSGTFVVANCIVEVLPKTFLPPTGSNMPGVGITGFAFVLVGVALVAASRRDRRPVAAGVSVIASRLRGRTSWSPPEPRLVLRSADVHRTRRPLLSGWNRRRGGGNRRAGHTDG